MDNLNVMFIFLGRSNVHFSSNDNHSLSMTPIIVQLNQLERAAGGNLGPQRHVSHYCHPSSFFLHMLCYFPCVQTRARIVMIHKKKKKITIFHNSLSWQIFISTYPNLSLVTSFYLLLIIYYINQV